MPKKLPIVIMTEWENAAFLKKMKECLELWESCKLGND